MQTAPAAPVFEQVLTTCHNGYAYRVPPTVNINDFKCADWPNEALIFQGDIRVFTKGDAAFISLLDPSTGAEASRFPVEYRGAIPTLMSASDSSRYFILVVRDPTGTKMAFVGLGFREREAAFNFKVALSDHGKYLERKANPVAAPTMPQDFGLKQGEKIRISIKGGSKRGAAHSGAAPVTGFSAPPQ